MKGTQKMNKQLTTNTDIEMSIQNNQVVVSSRQVAEKFGKSHNHVLRDIETLVEGVSKNGQTQMYYLTTYVHGQNKQLYPEYLMNRDGFTLLAMGFTGQEALEWKLKFLAKFNEMERELSNPQNLMARALIEAHKILNDTDLKLKQTQGRLLQTTQQLETATRKIDRDKPKVEFAEAVIVAKTSCEVADLAKMLAAKGLDIGQNRLYAYLRDNGFLGKRGMYRNLPTQKSMNMGLMQIKTYTYPGRDNRLHEAHIAMITGKGQVYFVRRMLDEKRGITVDEYNEDSYLVDIA